MTSPVTDILVRASDIDSLSGAIGFVACVLIVTLGIMG